MDSDYLQHPRIAVREGAPRSVQSGIYVQKGGRDEKLLDKSKLSIVGSLFFRGWRGLSGRLLN